MRCLKFMVCHIKTMTRYDQLKIISPLFWILAFITSMMLAPGYEAELLGLSFALLVIAAVCADGLGIYKGYWRLPKGPVIYIGLAFWLLALLSIVVAEAPYIAYAFFFQFSLLPVAFLSFVLGHEPEKRLEIASWGFSATTAMLAVFAIIQYITLPEWLQSGSAVAYPIKNPNGLASLLALGVFASLLLAFRTQTRKYAMAAVLFAALSGLGIYTTGGRAVFIAMVLAFILMIALLPHVMRRRNARSIGFFIAVMGIGFVIFSMIAPGGTNGNSAGPAAEVGKTFEKTDKWLGSRPDIWRATWQIIQNHPVTGTGIGTFYLYYPEYRPQGEKSAGYMAHNDPLQFWAELGIAGPILFYAFLVAGLIRTVKAIRIGRQTHNADAQHAYLHMIVAFCALGVIIIHTHVSFPLYLSPILLAVGWHLAQWYNASSRLLTTEYAWIHVPARLSPRWHEPLIGVFLGVCVFIILGALSPIVASEHYIHRAERAANAGDVQSYSRYVNKADRFSLGMNPRAYQMAAAIPVRILKSGKQLSTQETRDLFRQAEHLLDQALRYNPRMAKSYTYKARARIGLAGRTGDAPAPEPAVLLKHALTLNPKFLPARETLYKYYKKQGKEGRAYSTLKKGMAWSYNHYDLRGYYRTLGREALKHGDIVLHARIQKKWHRAQRNNDESAGINLLRDSRQDAEKP